MFAFQLINVIIVVHLRGRDAANPNDFGLKGNLILKSQFPFYR